MKILWIYPELPYPLTSGFLRGFHLLRLLGQRHSITFLSLTGQTQVSPETLSVLEGYAGRIEIFSKCCGSEPRWLRMCGLIPLIGGRIQDSWNTRLAVKQMELTV